MSEVLRWLRSGFLFVKEAPIVLSVACLGLLIMTADQPTPIGLRATSEGASA